MGCSYDCAFDCYRLLSLILIFCLELALTTCDCQLILYKKQSQEQLLIISPVCEHLIFPYVSQRQLFIKIVNHVLCMSDSSCYLELSSLSIQVSLKLGSFNPLFEEILPIDVLKPRVIFQGHERWSPQSTFRLIFIQQLLHQFSRLFVFQGPRVFQLHIQYLFVYFQGIFTLFSERNISAHEFKHVDSQRVETYGESVSLSDDYFWCHVVRSSNKGKSLGSHNVSALDYLCSNQVYQFKIPIHINHEVLWLEVSHNDSLGGQVINYHNHGGNIKLSIFCAEEPDLSDGVVELFTLNKLHQ